MIKSKLYMTLFAWVALATPIAPAQASPQDPGDIKILVISTKDQNIPVYLEVNASGNISSIKAEISGRKYSVLPGKSNKQGLGAGTTVSVDATKLTESGGEVKISGKKLFFSDSETFRLVKEMGKWKTRDSRGREINGIRINSGGMDVILASLNPAKLPGDEGDARVSSVAMASSKGLAQDLGEQFVGDRSLDKRAVSSGSAI